jgi:hypothetical protein
MAQQSNDLRERLLAALPQPENLPDFRERIAALQAKHATALRWHKISGYTLVLLAVVLFWWSLYPGRYGTALVHSFQFGSALLYFVGAITLVGYKIYESQVATLKEIKQVQLQVLELQASLKKER